MNDTTVPIKSLQTTFRILEKLADENGATASEISDDFGLPKSTVYDHLYSLEDLGYITKDNGRYQISMLTLRLGDLRRHNMEIYEAAKQELTELATVTKEYASLTIEENHEDVIVATERGEHAVPLTVYNGIRMRMHATASGRAILANLPREKVVEIIESKGLDKITKNTINNREQLFDELEKIREQGYALGHEERVVGMRDVGAALIDKNGQVRGAITVWGPTSRIDDEKFKEEFPEYIRERSNVIEIQMNYE